MKMMKQYQEYVFYLFLGSICFYSLVNQKILILDVDFLKQYVQC